MAELEHDTSVAVASVVETNASRHVSSPADKSIGTLRCIVVSTVHIRRSMLVSAAHAGGWDTIVCGDADSGWTALKRQKFQLAIIDIDGVDDASQLKELGKDVAGIGDTLLMLCGNEGEALEEIWARQLGVWLYLPGVDQDSDVASLCEQARPVAEKLLGLPGRIHRLIVKRSKRGLAFAKPVVKRV